MEELRAFFKSGDDISIDDSIQVLSNTGGIEFFSYNEVVHELGDEIIHCPNNDGEFIVSFEVEDKLVLIYENENIISIVCLSADDTDINIENIYSGLVQSVESVIYASDKMLDPEENLSIFKSYKREN